MNPSYLLLAWVNSLYLLLVEVSALLVGVLVVLLEVLVFVREPGEAALAGYYLGLAASPLGWADSCQVVVYRDFRR